MKIIIIVLLSSILTSCSVINYYQVYQANAENGAIEKDKIVFENNSCKVSYNLWGEGGNVGFNVYNKTDDDITIDLTKTFFVLNGVAYEYFQNRTFTNSSSSATTRTSYPYYYWYWTPSKISGTISSKSYSTSFSEKSELTIPSKTSVKISEYHISNARYVICDLLKYPSKNKVKIARFEKTNSPVVFYNIITYKVKDDALRMENKFYVSEITNIPSSEMFTNSFSGECGRKLEYSYQVFKEVGPDKFYIHYTKEK